MVNQLVGMEWIGDRRGSHEKKERLLAGALRLMLEKGYPATTVDQVCKEAGVTKGAFFHYFDSKEAIGRAVVERFVSDLVGAFRAAPFRQLGDPLERVYAYIDFTAEMCNRAVLKDGCVLGLFSQELAAVNPAMRAVCEQSFRGWAEDLEALLDEATVRSGRRPAIDTAALAEHFIATIEGALILRKAYGDPEVVERSLLQFRDHVRLLLEGDSPTRRKEKS